MEMKKVYALIQEAINIIDNRPFRHDPQKKGIKSRLGGQNTVNCPPEPLPHFFTLAHGSRMGERSIDSFIVIDFPLMT